MDRSMHNVYLYRQNDSESNPLMSSTLNVVTPSLRTLYEAILDLRDNEIAMYICDLTE